MERIRTKLPKMKALRKPLHLMNPTAALTVRTFVLKEETDSEKAMYTFADVLRNEIWACMKRANDQQANEFWESLTFHDSFRRWFDVS